MAISRLILAIFKYHKLILSSIYINSPRVYVCLRTFYFAFEFQSFLFFEVNIPLSYRFNCLQEAERDCRDKKARCSTRSSLPAEVERCRCVYKCWRIEAFENCGILLFLIIFTWIICWNKFYFSFWFYIIGFSRRIWRKSITQKKTCTYFLPFNYKIS